MKKASIFLALCSIGFTYAQKVSEYKFVAVPSNFSDFKKNNFGLDKLLTKTLQSKKYTVISDNRNQWDYEAASNPCNVVFANILDDSSLFKNKVAVEFKDCNDKVILATKGSSSIKEFQEGFQDALKESLRLLPVANPVNQSNSQKVTNDVVDTKTQETVVNSNATKFSNGKLTLQKIQLDQNQFILAEANSSVPFATFKNTTKKDVFRVKLASGDSTLGYYENGNIVIELPSTNGEYSKEVFSSK